MYISIGSELNTSQRAQEATASLLGSCSESEIFQEFRLINAVAFECAAYVLFTVKPKPKASKKGKAPSMNR